MKNNLIEAGIIAAFVAIVATSVFLHFVTVGTQTTQSFGASPAGTTNDSAKSASVIMNLSSQGANGTSSSILNSSGNDRYVTGWGVGCSGLGTSFNNNLGGLANLQISVGTTSTATPTGASAVVFGWTPVAFNFSVSTSTVTGLIASSTMQTATSTLGGLWNNGSYMTFMFNATNTAACTPFVNYVTS